MSVGREALSTSVKKTAERVEISEMSIGKFQNRDQSTRCWEPGEPWPSSLLVHLHRVSEILWRTHGGNLGHNRRHLRFDRARRLSSAGFHSGGSRRWTGCGSSGGTESFASVAWIPSCFEGACLAEEESARRLVFLFFR
jgi:hypothetical protein